MNVGDWVIAKFDLQHRVVIDIWVKKGSVGVVIETGLRKVRKHSIDFAVVDFNGSLIDTPQVYLKLVRKSEKLSHK